MRGGHNGRGAVSPDFYSPAGRARYWACERKASFVSERKARQVAAECQTTKLYAYRCPHCKDWHLSKKGPKP